MRAKALFSLPNTAGAVAFSCTVDPHRAAYPDAVVLMRLGDMPDDARRRLRKIADHRARVCTLSVMHTSKNPVPWRSFPLGLVGQLPQRLVLRALRLFLQEGFHGK
jgi:hypothetical protein